MPYLVNGQPVPEEWIREEEQRLTRDLRFQTIADEAERARQLRVAAARSTKGRCGSRFERQFRLQRTCAEMMAGATPAEPHKVEAFYQANRETSHIPAFSLPAPIVWLRRGRSG